MGPPVISWFIKHEIIPMNTIVISTINHWIQPLINQLNAISWPGASLIVPILGHHVFFSWEVQWVSNTAVHQSRLAQKISYYIHYDPGKVRQHIPMVSKWSVFLQQKHVFFLLLPCGFVHPVVIQQPRWWQNGILSTEEHAYIWLLVISQNPGKPGCYPKS